MKTPVCALPVALASLETSALCLLVVPTPTIVSPAPFIVGPPGPRHGRRRRLSPTSPATAAFPPLISLDQST